MPEQPPSPIEQDPAAPTSASPPLEPARPLGTGPAILLFLGAALDWTIPLGGISVPIATGLMGAALAWLLFQRKGKQLPSISWGYAILLALLATGFLGAGAISKGTIARELIQFLEIFAVAVAAGAMLKDTREWLTGATVSLCLVASANVAQAAGLPITQMSLARSAVLAATLLPLALETIATHQRKHRWHFAFGAIAAAALTLLVGLPTLLTNGSVALHLPLVAAALVSAALGNRASLAGAIPAAVLLALATLLIHGNGASVRFHGKYDDNHYTRLAIEAEAATTSPLVAPFGHGPGQYRQGINSLRQDLPNIPHPTDNKVPRDSNSQYLVTLVEGGPLAALALAVLLFGAVWPSRRLPDQLPSLQAAAAALAVGALFTTVLGRGIGIACGTILGMALNHPPLVIKRPKSIAAPTFAGIALLLTLAAAFAVPSLNNMVVTAANIKPRTHTPPRIVKPATSAENVIRLKLEGEAYTNATGGFIRVSANDTSGNAMLVLPDGSGKATGHASYEVDVPEAGAWTLSARVFWTDGCSNSLGFQFDKQTHRVSSELFDQWHILQTARPIRLPAGKISIRVKNVEDGVRLDWFELTKAE